LRESGKKLEESEHFIELREYGQKLLASEKAVEVFTKSLMSNAAMISDVSEEQRDNVLNFLTTD
jgi:hypothetical protein